jgi:hypothetical protein
MKLPAFVDSPFFPFCIPPALAVLQFLVLSVLLTTGFPDVPASQKTNAGLLISALFGSCLLTLFGAASGTRQVFYSDNKVVATIGTAFNVFYLLGFVLFFIGVFVTNASN